MAEPITFRVTVHRENHPDLYDSLILAKKGRLRSEKMQLYASEHAQLMRMIREAAGTGVVLTKAQPIQQDEEIPPKQDNEFVAHGKLAMASFGNFCDNELGS